MLLEKGKMRSWRKTRQTAMKDYYVAQWFNGESYIRLSEKVKEIYSGCLKERLMSR
jgi:hypothetical protein